MAEPAGWRRLRCRRTPRADDVLAGVTVPVPSGVSPAAGWPSHLEEIREELISRRYPAGAHYLPPGGAAG